MLLHLSVAADDKRTNTSSSVGGLPGGVFGNLIAADHRMSSAVTGRGREMGPDGSREGRDGDGGGRANPVPVRVRTVLQ